jgi:CheY-like chemotaxis protein
VPKILVVDDYERALKILSRRFARLGFEVETAATGDEAVRIGREAQPDLILMDVNLPVKDGWTATRELKQAERTKHIPIIALTADDLPEQRRRSEQAGCDDFESKPFDFERLVEKVKRLIAAAEG